jgi:hypothetical protein
VPFVSKDGRLQIVVARTPFPSGEVSRNAGAVAAVESAVDEARRLGGSAVRIGITGDVGRGGVDCCGGGDANGSDCLGGVGPQNGLVP